jgi:hypothetical protein
MEFFTSCIEGLGIGIAPGKFHGKSENGLPAGALMAEDRSPRRKTISICT